MLARPRNEYPQFPAALSFVMLLSPAEAAATLEQRAMALRGELAGLDPDLEETAGLPRVVLMDDEYRRAMVTAELAWLDGVISDLLSGSLTWSYELLASLALPLQPDGQVVTAPD